VRFTIHVKFTYSIGFSGSRPVVVYSSGELTIRDLYTVVVSRYDSLEFDIRAVQESSATGVWCVDDHLQPVEWMPGQSDCCEGNTVQNTVA
jgi:hypothetical protein